jgi:hypothetical protein
MPDSSETVLVTGASSGIGKELAECFAADGCRLILVARSRETLAALADGLKARHGVDSLVVCQDLSCPAAAEEVLREISNQGWPVHVLVNNAGFGEHGRFQDTSIERQLAMVQLNVGALLHLTHLVLPQMTERRRGAILNVGSTAAFQPGPYAAVYFASKAFVLSFSDALREELRHFNIGVTCLCPGPTQTNFGNSSGMNRTRVFRWTSMTAQDVARAGHRALRRGRSMVIPGLLNKLLAWATRFAPRGMLLRIAGYFNNIV